MTSVLDAFTPEQAAQLRPHVRPAFVPRVEEGEVEGPVSKIGGVPWLSAGTEWPTCPNCNQAMALVVQLDLEGLPPGAPTSGRGLAQLFYCTSSEPLCEVDCQAFFPFAKSCVTRLLDKRAPARDAVPRPVQNPVAPKRIVGWSAAEEDLPNAEELADPLGVDVPYNSPLHDALHAANRPLAGDKLLGGRTGSSPSSTPPAPSAGRRCGSCSRSTPTIRWACSGGTSAAHTGASAPRTPRKWGSGGLAGEVLPRLPTQASACFPGGTMKANQPGGPLAEVTGRRPEGHPVP